MPARHLSTLARNRLSRLARCSSMDDIYEPPTRRELVWTLALMVAVLAATQLVVLL